MKKNILKIVVIAVFMLVCVLIMPKTALATSINKVEITVPEPTIGKILTNDASKIQVKSDDGESFEIETIEWYCNEFDNSTNQLLGYKKVSDFSKVCNNSDKYQLKLKFLFLPEQYQYNSEYDIFLNGTKLNKSDIILGESIINEITYQMTEITYDFEYAKAQKEISKIEVTTPMPIAGEKLNKDISSEFEVKIDDTERLNIRSVEWTAEDFSTLTNDIAEAGKKYNVTVKFDIPNKYVLSSNVIVTVNGEQIDVKNIDEFNYASEGDLNFDYTVVTKLLEAKEVSKEEIKENLPEEIKGENVTEEIKKDETVKEIKNPKTGNSITKSFAILIIAVAGIALIINSIKKQNR